MAKSIAYCWTTSELEKFSEAELRAEIERCRMRLTLARTAYHKESFTSRIHELEKLVARKLA